jgi:hypothetical protein
MHDRLRRQRYYGSWTLSLTRKFRRHTTGSQALCVCRPTRAHGRRGPSRPDARAASLLPPSTAARPSRPAAAPAALSNQAGRRPRGRGQLQTSAALRSDITASSARGSRLGILFFFLPSTPGVTWKASFRTSLSIPTPSRRRRKYDTPLLYKYNIGLGLFHLWHDRR